MIPDSDNQPIQFPDRNEITLCEAFTAFCLGKVVDAGEWFFLSELPVEVITLKARILIDRLQKAAYAELITFRALKNGERPIEGHKDIPHLYFSDTRGFAWNCDEIWSRGLDPYPKQHKPRPPHFMMDWHDVHLEREDFKSLLRDMGVSIPHHSEVNILNNEAIPTGAPGRPSSMHYVLKMVEARFNAGDCPRTLTEFSRQLAAALQTAHPHAPPVTPKTISNKLREQWNKRKKSPEIIGPT